MWQVQDKSEWGTQVDWMNIIVNMCPGKALAWMYISMWVLLVLRNIDYPASHGLIVLNIAWEESISKWKGRIKETYRAQVCK